MTTGRILVTLLDLEYQRIEILFWVSQGLKRRQVVDKLKFSEANYDYHLESTVAIFSFLLDEESSVFKRQQVLTKINPVVRELLEPYKEEISKNQNFFQHGWDVIVELKKTELFTEKSKEEKPPKKLLLLPAKTGVIDEKPEKEERVEEDFVDDRIKFNPPPDVIYILSTEKVPEEEITQPLPPIKPEPSPDEPEKPEEDKPEPPPDEPPPDGRFIPIGDRRKGPRHPQPPVEPEPEPVRDNTRLFRILTVVIGIGVVLIVGFFVINWIQGLVPPPPPRTATPISQIIPFTFTPIATIEPTITPTRRPSLTAIKSPTNTTTPTQTPIITPVPLPINENFSDGYSDLWWVLGNPVVVESAQYMDKTGLLTAMEDEVATMVVGNTGWDNYVISLDFERLFTTSPYPQFAFRYIDVNNMILLKCGLHDQCTWYIVDNGQEKKIVDAGSMYFGDGAIATVKGDNISIVNPAWDSYHIGLIIPNEYKEKFARGGFMITFGSGSYFDYINIQELP